MTSPLIVFETVTSTSHSTSKPRKHEISLIAEFSLLEMITTEIKKEQDGSMTLYSRFWNHIEGISSGFGTEFEI